MTVKPSGIALELTQYVKKGRLSQYVEPLSEASQMLEEDGWKPSDNPSKAFVEVS